MNPYQIRALAGRVSPRLPTPCCICPGAVLAGDFFDDWRDAFRHVVAALGGAKVVGSQMLVVG